MGPTTDHSRLILVVDDDDSTRSGLSRILSDLGHRVDAVADAELATERVQSALPDLVITDLQLPGKDGMLFIADLQERGVDSTIIVLTGHGSINSAVEATRRGVFDYLVKPIDRDQLTTAVRKGLEHADLRREVSQLRRQMALHGHFQELVGRSASMLELYRIIEQVAPSTASVLITGESGTGKDVTARTIHRLSPRASSGPLVAINCAAIPETLLESEIFGHERGAFTGATALRAGCFELANGGTIFLDEIGQMPVHLQAKLLRILEAGSFRRVGGAKEIHVDVRVLAATNSSVEELVEQGAFREDLYYRLNVFKVALPPLRERRDDIPLLAEHFRTELAAKNNKSVTGFSTAALNYLAQYGWPGNVRELRNAVEHAVVLCPEGDIQPQHLPSAVRGVTAGVPRADDEGVSVMVGTRLADAERMIILQTLATCSNNKTKTAKLLGISVKTLYTKLHRYGDAHETRAKP